MRRIIAAGVISLYVWSNGLDWRHDKKIGGTNPHAVVQK
jgi:hypothetical protein